MMMYLILVPIVLLLLYLLSQKRPSNYPPGPYGLPVVGHLLQLAPSPYLALIKLKEKYGPIVSIDFGSYRAIGISDYKILREALADQAFAGRPNMNVFQQRSRDVVARGLLFSEGRQWKEQRSFAIRQLTQLGYVKASLETMISDEVLEFTNTLKTECDHPISLRTKFHSSIVAILWSLVVGERGDSEEISRLFKDSTEIIEENNGLASIAMLVPWLAKLFPKLSGMEEMNKNLGPLWAFLGRHIEEHRQTFIPGQIRDLLDAYLNEIHNTTDPESSFYKDVGERSMMTSMLDLFFAGGETTANTLHWLCLHLAVNQDAQKRLQAEIDNVIGRSRMPQLSDETDMPYAYAVIQESMRMAALIPMALFHNTTQDTTLRGYKIPKNTMVLMNIYSALHDKGYWGDPENFRPERHIDENGKLIKHEAMLAFSCGRRVCFGEQLARNQLFLWVTTMFQSFSIKTDKPEITLDPIVTWVLLPPDHQVIFKQRPITG